MSVQCEAMIVNSVKKLQAVARSTSFKYRFLHVHRSTYFHAMYCSLHKGADLTQPNTIGVLLAPRYQWCLRSGLHRYAIAVYAISVTGTIRKCNSQWLWFRVADCDRSRSTKWMTYLCEYSAVPMDVHICFFHYRFSK